MTQYGPGVPLVVHWWLQEAEEPGHGVVLVLVFEFRTDSNFRANFFTKVSTLLRQDKLALTFQFTKVSTLLRQDKLALTFQLG